MTMATADEATVLHFDEAAPGAELEWIVTNGLGGYASGPVRGGLTRRFHGLLIASLAAPAGRMQALPLLRVSLVSADRVRIIEDEDVDAPSTTRARSWPAPLPPRSWLLPSTPRSSSWIAH